METAMDVRAEQDLLDCDCDGWKNGMRQINGAIVLAYAHGSVYTGGKFLFCPWCGKKREVDHSVGFYFSITPEPQIVNIWPDGGTASG